MVPAAPTEVVPAAPADVLPGPLGPESACCCCDLAGTAAVVSVALSMDGTAGFDVVSIAPALDEAGDGVLAVVVLTAPGVAPATLFSPVRLPKMVLLVRLSVLVRLLVPLLGGIDDWVRVLLKPGLFDVPLGNLTGL